eukprot:3677760-Prymnesium_polylepis.1
MDGNGAPPRPPIRPDQRVFVKSCSDLRKRAGFGGRQTSSTADLIEESKSSKAGTKYRRLSTRFLGRRPAVL